MIGEPYLNRPSFVVGLRGIAATSEMWIRWCRDVYGRPRLRGSLMCSSPSGIYTRVCHAGFFLLSFSLRARSSGKSASRSGCFFSSRALISRYVRLLSKLRPASRVHRARSSTGRTGLYPGGDGNGSGSVEESIVDVGDGRELPGLDASFVDADGDDADGDDAFEFAEF